MIEEILLIFINIAAAIIVLHFIRDRKINFKDLNLYAAFFLMSGFLLVNYIYTNSFMRLFISTTIVFVGNYIIFRDEIRETLISTLMNQLIVVISEVAYLLIYIILVHPLGGEELINSVFGSLILNIVVSIIMVVISVLQITKNIYSKLLSTINKIKVSTLLIFALVLIFPINILVFMVYLGSSIFTVLITIILFLILYSIILYFAINEKNKNIEFKQQNDALVSSLFEYEKMLDYQRVNNHENKNQLLVIKDMIRKTNKKALEYIDTIIDEKRKDDEGLYAYAKIIPAGGLQGLIYQKMLEMKEKHINIELNVDKEVRKVNLDNISNRTKYDLYRAVGIIIDNAIDETLKLKEKSIMIIMYKEDNNIVIEVSNRCKDIPDLSKIDEKGYTTKSTGHGYGLSLLKSIANNNCISNIRSINKDIFTQIIKVKIN